MEQNLLDRMLCEYQEQKTAVTIVLQNKARISGRIRSFDSYVIVLENEKNDILFRHAVSSLSPALAAEQAKPALRRSEPARPAVRRPQKPASPPSRPKQVQQAPRPAASPSDTAINSGMKEGLLRWMQEQKASK